MATEDFLIKYGADLAQLKAQLKSIEEINKALAARFGSDFSQAVDIISRKLTGLKTDVTFKIATPDPKVFDKVNGQIETFTTLIRNANGETVKLTEKIFTGLGQDGPVIKDISTNFQVLGQSVGSVVKNIESIIPPLTNLKQQFLSVSQVNKELADNLSGNFSKATQIIGKNIDSLNQKKITFNGQDFIVPVQKFGAVIQTANGQFQQLIKTVVSLPDGTQQAKIAFRDLGTELEKANRLVGLKKVIEPKTLGDLNTVINQLQTIQSIQERIFKAGINAQVLSASQPELVKSKGISPVIDGKKVEAQLQIFQTQVKLTDGSLRTLTDAVTSTDGAVLKLISTLGKAASNPIVKPQTLGDLKTITAQLTQVEAIQKRIADTGNTAGILKIGPTQVTAGKAIPKIIDGKEVTEQVKTFQTQVKLADGTSKTLTDTVTSTGGAVTKMGSVFKETAVGSLTFGQNLKSLAVRAAATIPIWFLLRNAILGVPRAIGQGIKDLVAFDLALQKIKRNLQGSSEEINSSLASISQRITELSLQTGKSTEEIAEAVKKFATIGFSPEESLAGGVAATKASILLFDDAGKTAESFARALKVLADRSKDASSFQQQLNETFALATELEKTNQFELSEVNESLLKVAPSAKAAGLSMRELLVLLSSLGTAGRTGSQAGTLLRSSLNQLLGSLDKLAPTLGVIVNEGDRTFDVLKKVFKAAEQLSGSGLIKERGDVVEAFGAIFGGERGSQVITALASVNKLLLANAEVLPDVVKFNTSFEERLKSSSSQADQFSNKLKQLRKSFVESVLGTNGLNKALSTLNKTVDTLIPAMEKLGIVIGAVFANFGVIAGSAILTKFGPSILESLQIAFLLGGANGAKALFVGFSKGLAKFFSPAVIVTIVAVALAALPDLLKKKIEDGLKKIQIDDDIIFQALRGQLDKATLIDVIAKIQDGTIKIENVKETVVALRKRLQEDFDKEGKPVIKVSPTISIEELTQINEAIIQDTLDRLQVEGATGSQIADATIKLKEQFGISRNIVDKVKERLNLEKEINNEKRLQNKLSSDSVKLFDIAQKFGVKSAKSIADVLAGTSDFTTFIRRGGKDVEIFKKEFEDIFKSKQAESFFKGDVLKGFQDLQGGFGVNIQEGNSLRNQIPKNDIDAVLRRNKALAEVGGKLPGTPSIDFATIRASTVQLFLPSGSPATNLLTNSTPVRNNSTLTSENLAFLKTQLPAFSQGQKLEIAVTVDLNGEQNITVGTPEELAKVIGNQVSEQVSRSLILKIENSPNDPFVQSLNKNTERF